jgi:hypothetical protein
MYPGFMQGGTVRADATTDPGDAPAGTDPGMLFTGGVDSLATYVRHREEAPTLINLKGWVVGVDEDERWHHVKRRIEAYGERFGVETQFLRSNMFSSFLDVTMLTAHFADEHDGGWYSAVGGGLGLTGLCAPLATAEGMDRLYIAASVWEGMEPPPVTDYWDGPAMPWGTHPDIENEIAWGATECVHDAFELYRQERIEVIADYVRRHDPDLPVRSCSSSQTAQNCGRCEKCLRTALGLALAGLDPADHGFDLAPDVGEHAVEQFERGAWLSDQHGAYHWEYFQQELPEADELPIGNVEPFLEWLPEADFEEIAGSSTRDRGLRAVARHTPYPVYGPLYSVYTSLRESFDRA